MQCSLMTFFEPQDTKHYKSVKQEGMQKQIQINKLKKIKLHVILKRIPSI